MNILMITNTYSPHVGGVANSVKSFAREFKNQGHQVLVVCPEHGRLFHKEKNVVRIPAIKNINDSNFSMALPIPGILFPILEKFKPDIVHSHHPFFLGDTALRISSTYNIPIVFTYHTNYEKYTHYALTDSSQIKEFVKSLSIGYANLCDAVIAPSKSMKGILKNRGVNIPLHTIPTGIDIQKFSNGNGSGVRKRFRIPKNGFVIGHVGRLAPEKNLEFLAQSAAEFIANHKNCYFLVVGKGPSKNIIKDTFHDYGLGPYLRLVGEKSGQHLINSYHAMDAFVLASKTETQGIVLIEALASSVPVVALDSPGVRDVITHKTNGFLVKGDDKDIFSSYLEEIYNLSEESRKAFGEKAKKSAQKYSIQACSKKALRLYSFLVKRKIQTKDIKNSLWWTVMRRIEIEYEVWSNIFQSFRQAYSSPSSLKIRFLIKIKRAARALKSFFNLGEWDIKLFKIPKLPKDESKPGVILIQIDGLSKENFNIALKRGRLPFLKKLISQKKHTVHSLYSGLPSTTPAVQGELFYGVKGIVPSFQFFSRSDNQIKTMLEHKSSIEIESQLKKRGEPLLKGGSSYSNSFSGGSKEAHFCGTTLGWNHMSRVFNPLSILISIFFHFLSFIRVLVLVIIELFLAIIDCLRGIIKSQDLFKEIKFVPIRVSICILLRELITIGACIDTIRGLPIIHVNYLGYDEQAHRRGPSSEFAHWTLKGIDRAIKKIYKSSQFSDRRNYEIIVYSDHGQEKANLYCKDANNGIETTLNEILNHVEVKKTFNQQDIKNSQLLRAQWLRSQSHKTLEKKETQEDSKKIHITALGPIAHIYFPNETAKDDIKKIAKELSAQDSIPAVIANLPQNKIYGWKKQEEFVLPKQVNRFLRTDHPFYQDVSQDLITLCQHPDAGDLILLGWILEKSITFANENGSHGGLGLSETHAFAILPPSVSSHKNKKYLRPLHLREITFQILKHTIAFT